MKNEKLVLEALLDIYESQLFSHILDTKIEMKIRKVLKKIEKDMKYYKSIDKGCSKCGDYADVIIPNKIKLCSDCYKEMERE